MIGRASLEKIEKKEFPTLQQLAELVVAKNYHEYPSLPGVPERIKQKVLIQTNTECARIDHRNICGGIYAARRVTDSAKRGAGEILEALLRAEVPAPCDDQPGEPRAELEGGIFGKIPTEHDRNPESSRMHTILWQQLRNNHTQNFKDPDERELLLKTASIVSPWIFTLDLKRMPAEMDFKVLADFLPNLMELRLKYSEGSSLEYKKNFGMKFAEAANLSEMIKNANNLIILNLSGNLIDDDLFKFLMQGLTLNISLVNLNLSHNKISDQGARRLSKFLIRNEILVHLNLSNNLIGYDGSRYLAQALKINKTLETLNLKLNNIDDKAGSKLFKDLTFNEKLKRLDVEANSLGPQTARKISLYIQNPSSLQSIMIGNNNFSAENLQSIKIALPDEKLKAHFENSNYSELRLK